MTSHTLHYYLPPFYRTHLQYHLQPQRGSAGIEALRPHAINTEGTEQEEREEEQQVEPTEPEHAEPSDCLLLL